MKNAAVYERTCTKSLSSVVLIKTFVYEQLWGDDETNHRDDRSDGRSTGRCAAQSASRDAGSGNASGDVKVGENQIELETPYSAREVAALADFSHSPADQAAVISSGSFRTDGMIVIPCSMKTLAGIRAGYAEGLVGRAADVVLKEGRKLVLVPREMPLSTIHLENMLALSRMGVAMVPPMPAYYNHPKTIEDVTDHVVTRVLDQFGLEYHKARRWSGLRAVENVSQENE